MSLKKKDLAKAGEIKDFLETHYQQRIDYEFLAKKYGMNTTKLKLAFKEVTNNNIHAYLTKIRIEHAKQLLENTEETTSWISEQVGLDRSNFNIHFKKITGKTPSQWRKNSMADFKEQIK